MNARIRDAGQRLQPDWNPEVAERVFRRVEKQRRRRIAVRGIAVAAVSVALVLGARVALSPRPREAAVAIASPAVTTSPSVTMNSLRLNDGSRVTALQPNSQWVLAADEPSRVQISLRSGRGHFDVVPRPQRTFTVEAGEVTVSVLGTAFTVERIADRVGVQVERGRVEVRWASGQKVLAAGEEGWFPPLVAAAPARPEKERKLRLKTPVTSEELMSAADLARIEGRPEQAAELLRRVLDQNHADPAVAIAAFTLGRLLLFDLAQFGQAAEAFARARELAPLGAFAEDALAREVEAWARAGDSDRARERAEAYRLAYPGGRRLAEVRAFGRLD